MRPSPLLPLKLLLLAAVGCVTAEPTDTALTDTGDTGDTGVAPDCVDPESILLTNGEPSGFERCADGAVNRVAAVTYDPVNPNEACRGDEDELYCAEDAECVDGPNGLCAHEAGIDGGPDMPNGLCNCEYTCATDADCGEAQACVPAEAREGSDRPTCEPAACFSTEDCASGECGLGNFFNGCYYADQLECRAPALDTCHGDAECDASLSQSCDVENPDNGFACVSQGCDIGRPLLVNDLARTAPPAPRRDWSHIVVPLPAPPKTRAALAAHWATIAALEHASVGSFARFTLQLLAIGAPAELLLATQEAAADEVRHAQFAYALASFYAGTAVGPGPLPLHGAMPALDPQNVAFALIDEACVGETLGAAEALEAAEACIDPAVRAGLLTIAADEARHAALAWRSLRWLVDTFPKVRAPAAARLRAAIAVHAARLDAAAAREVHDLTMFGVPSSRSRTAAQRRALRSVVEPVGAALFSPA